jgi:protein-glutamine gamma-glutamyltransferase
LTFAREKRLLLGASALLVAVPLPLNDALEWPALALFLVFVALFLRRAWQGSERWLSHRALNLLGLAYLPLLVVDVAVSGRIQFVRPILHLILFGLAAKLWSLEREKDKWQVWIGIFFLFLAAMSTSTHPSVVLYLVAFAALSVVILLRFVHLHVLSSFGPRGESAPALPVGRMVAGVVAATIALAVPLFTLLPRVRTPMVSGPAGFGSQPTLPQAGFSDEMSLDLIGRIRGNSEIALRMRFEGRPPDPQSLRLKASAYDVWEGRSWRQLPQGELLDRQRGSDAVRLADSRPVASAEIVLEPLRSRSLVLPLETVEVELPGRRLTIDAAGALGIGSYPTAPIEYRARLTTRPRSLAAPPGAEADSGGPLDTRGISDRMRGLAAGWAGEGTARERAERIEARFHRDFGYTTLFLGRGGESPLETFLFETRQGHCEYFASSMVLLLRAQGIPARLVTGFYGAEWSAWEGAWIVRQSNAHAWVEAWLGDAEGWAVYDPTPPAGLPAAQPRDLRLWTRQAWEAVLFRWDRWVISYDFDDQVGVLGGLRSAWDELVARLFGGDRPEAMAAGETVGGAAESSGAEAAPGRDRIRLAAAALAVALAAAVAGVLVLRRRPRWSATAAYLRLRRALAGAGLAVPDSLAPLALARLASRRLSEAAMPAARVVDGYLAEAYAGQELGEEALARLRADVAAVEAAARRLRSRRGRAAPPARRAA